MKAAYQDQLREYREQVVDVKTTPAVLYIESVKGCPSTCIMCKAQPTKPVKISSDILKKLEPYYDALEVLSIHGDGEPLLADLDYFVDQSLAHDLVLHMNSTGAFLTKRIADHILQTRLSVRFSIHAGRPETYHKIMGNDFEKVKEQISYLTSESKKNDIAQDFWFSFIVMKENADEFDDFLKLAHDCGIQHVRCMQLYPNPNNVKPVHLRGMEFNYLEQSAGRYIQEFYRRLPEYRVLADELGISIEHGNLGADIDFARPLFELANKITDKIAKKNLFPLFPQNGRCAAPWLGQLIVEQSGNVFLCCGSNYSIGNIHESSLEEIWHSNKMKAIRASFNKGSIPRLCGFCKGFGFSNYPNNSFPSSPRDN